MTFLVVLVLPTLEVFVANQVKTNVIQIIVKTEGAVLMMVSVKIIQIKLLEIIKVVDLLS